MRAREQSPPPDLGPWFHNLHLPGGLRTAPDHPLGDFPDCKWRRVSRVLPEDLSGWRVLDIGCNAGFYSFALAARGAEVLAIDTDERYLAQAEWAAERLELARPPRFRRMSVYGIGKLRHDFDLVWFMGVAYHLRHPLLALDLVRALQPGFLMFQMMGFPDAPALEPPADFPLDGRDRLREPGWPRLAFVEHRLAADPTNWWLANDACAQAMLRSAGFRPLSSPEDETWWCEQAARDEMVAAELRQVLEGCGRRRGRGTEIAESLLPPLPDKEHRA